MHPTLVHSYSATSPATAAWRPRGFPGSPTSPPDLRLGAGAVRHKAFPALYSPDPPQTPARAPHAPPDALAPLRSAEVTRRVLLGTFATSSDAAAQYYERAQRVRGVVAREFAEAFRSVDVLLAPSGEGACLS